MAKEKPRTITVGDNGEVKLPLDAMEALGLEPGESVTIRIDTRRKQVHLERFVDDPWSEALKKKDERDFEDLMGDQKAREAEAKRIFDQRMKNPPKGKKKPEDDPGYWR